MWLNDSGPAPSSQKKSTIKVWQKGNRRPLCSSPLAWGIHILWEETLKQQRNCQFTWIDQPPYPMQPKDLLAGEGKFTFWRACTAEDGLRGRRGVKPAFWVMTLYGPHSLSGVGTLVSDICLSGRRLEDCSLGTLTFKSMSTYDLNSNKIKPTERG